MFGLFDPPHASIGWTGGGPGGGPGVFAGPGMGPGTGGGIPPGGFPGMFPGTGVSNSGWAGLTDAQKKDCTKKGQCVMGPPPSLMGPRRI